MKKTISHILLDIEGTTCPVSFVSDTLFPYAIRELEAYLQRHHQEESVKALIEEAFQLWLQDAEAKAQKLLRQALAAIQPQSSKHENSRDDQTGQRYTLIIPYLHWLIEQDRKSAPLKELQGMIWQEGYSRGELKSTLFEEVPQVLKDWQGRGLALGVYSSGSIAAQKLLYGYSQAGDLTPLFKYWFDTRSGPKHQPKSYQRICEAMRVSPEQVLFISDSEAELQAATAAQLQVALSDREKLQDSAVNSDKRWTRVSRLTQIELPT